MERSLITRFGFLPFQVFTKYICRVGDEMLAGNFYPHILIDKLDK
jgi:hypothetical protein